MPPSLPTYPSRHAVFRAGACLALAAASGSVGAACVTRAGGVPPLLDYAGHDTGERNLLAAPAVAAGLAHLTPAVRQYLVRNLDVGGPIDLVGCHLVLTGNAPHLGGEQDAILDLDLYSEALTVAIHARGRIDIYVDNRPTAPAYRDLPDAVRQWAVLADMGFPYQRPASVQVHALRR